jgi:hypothetical protein
MESYAYNNLLYTYMVIQLNLEVRNVLQSDHKTTVKLRVCFPPSHHITHEEINSIDQNLFPYEMGLIIEILV